MLVTATTIATPNARKYLAQLAKHFAHKIAVEATENEARFVLPVGPARLRANDEGLHVHAESDSDEGIARARHVIWSHLERFAFRESLPEPDWQLHERDQAAEG